MAGSCSSSGIGRAAGPGAGCGAGATGGRRRPAGVQLDRRTSSAVPSGQSAGCTGRRRPARLHVYRIPPGVLGDPGQRLPHAGDPLGADGEGHVRAAAARARSPAKYPASARSAIFRGRRRPVPDRPRQRGQRPAQQGHHGRTGVLVAGQQIGGQRDLGLGPGRHVRQARAPGRCRPRRVSCCRTPPRRWRRCRWSPARPPARPPARRAADPPSGRSPRPARPRSRASASR